MMNLWNSQQSHDRDDYICFSFFLKEDSTFHSFFYQTWLKWRFWIHEVFALDGKTLHVKVQPRPTRYRLTRELGNQQTQVGLKILGYLVIIVYAILQHMISWWDWPLKDPCHST